MSAADLGAALGGSVETAMEQHVLSAGGVLTFVGFIMMVQCRKVWQPTVCTWLTRGEITGVDSADPTFQRWAALLSHFAFLAGNVIFAFGLTALGLSLQMPPALAVLAGSTCISSSVAYMSLMRCSPIGVPHCSGPPVPARLIIATVEGLLLMNFAQSRDTLYARIPVPFVMSSLVLAVTVPFLVGQSHKRKGWKNQPMKAMKAAMKAAKKAKAE